MGDERFDRPHYNRYMLEAHMGLDMTSIIHKHVNSVISAHSFCSENNLGVYSKLSNKQRYEGRKHTIIMKSIK